MSAGLALALLLATTPIRLEEAREQSRQSSAAQQAVLTQQKAVDAQRLARSAILPQLALSAEVGHTVAGTQTMLMSQPVGGYAALLGGGSNVSYEDTPVDMAGYSRGSYGLTLSATQLLYDGGRWWRLIDRAGAQAEAATGQLAEQRLAAEYEAIRRFYELYRAQETVRVLEATVQRSQEQLERARALYTAGRADRMQEIAAEVNLGNDRITVLKQRAGISAAQADLAVYLARPGNEELQAVAPAALASPPASPPPVEEAQQEARRQRPLLRAVQRQLDAAALGVELAHGGYLPRVVLQGSYSRQGQTVDPVYTDPTKQNVLSGGVDLRWDLFTGFSSSAEENQARADQAAAELELHQAQREMEALVATSLAALAARIEETTVAGANLEVARRGLELAEQRFQAGAGSTLEVRDSQLKVAQAELAVLGSRIDVEIARAALSRATGGLGSEGSR